MCLAIPGKIERLYETEDGLHMALVNFNGVTRNVSVEWLPEVRKDDYILVHAGSALSIIDEKRARESLELLREWSDMADLN